MKLIIRPAKFEDLSAISQIEEACFKPEEVYPRWYLRSLLAYSKCFLVAEVEGRVVAYAVALVGGKSAHLVSIATLPAYRRRGIGSALLKRLLSTLKGLEVDEVRLEVRRSNWVARRLYSRLGFRIVDEIKGYYGDGEDAVVMLRKL